MDKESEKKMCLNMEKQLQSPLHKANYHMLGAVSRSKGGGASKRDITCFDTKAFKTPHVKFVIDTCIYNYTYMYI